MFNGDKPTVTFADVAGVEEAKAELAEVVEFLKEPDKFTALGAYSKRGAARRTTRHGENIVGARRRR